MNEFYSIANENTSPKDEYQLQNLGKERETISAFSRGSRNSYEGREPKRWSISEKVKKEDYDGLFAFKLTQVRPPYEINKTIEYHLSYYINNGGDKETFIKQLKYVIVPYFKQHKYSTVHLELLNEWIEENETNNKKRQMGNFNINGSNNIVNNAGGDIHQSGISINVTENQYQELKDCGVDDNQINELREIVSNPSQDKPTLKSRLIKWLGAVTVSVASKGLIDSLPKIQEFAHNLMP